MTDNNKISFKKEIATQIEVLDSDNNNLGVSGNLEIINTQKTFNKIGKK